jgi:hypothetical protein
MLFVINRLFSRVEKFNFALTMTRTNWTALILVAFFLGSGPLVFSQTNPFDLRKKARDTTKSATEKVPAKPAPATLLRDSLLRDSLLSDSLLRSAPPTADSATVAVVSELDSTIEKIVEQPAISSGNPFDIFRDPNALSRSSRSTSIRAERRSSAVSETGEEEMAEDETSSVDPLPVDVTVEEAVKSDPPGEDISSKEEADEEKVPEKNEEIITPPVSRDWSKTIVFGLLLFSILLLTFLVNVNRLVVSNIFRTIFNDNYFNLMFREYRRGDTPLLHRLLYVLFFLNAGLFVYLSLSRIPFLSAHTPLVYCVGGITLLYLIKHSVLRIAGGIFPIQKEMNQYSYAVMIYNIFLGVVLIPINGLLAFGPSGMSGALFFISVGIIILFYLVRQIRGLFIGSAHILYQKFHFFLYLCTTEIAPLLILIKSVEIFS